ncbi:MAG: HNH endonuclease [Prevotella sp.]|nr:HNH endonuclease [Prevotella sp.]
MKKILGLDLGTNSIGWAVVNVDENGKPQSIEGMGSRIVPLSSDDTNEFTKGNAISKNQSRTEKRTARKGYDRYQLRREYLTSELRKLNMLPDERLIKLPVLELWELRAKAATIGNQLTLPEIGRVLYHINQKRGYKHAKSDESADTKQKEYVAKVNGRYAMIIERNQTIGQYFAEKLKENEIETPKGKFYIYRIKEQVFPRRAYEAEFDQIMECQKVFYPEILTEKEIDKLRNKIIFYQRNLKSCKHLVSICDFEKREYENKEGKIVFGGPKVAPKSSPLFQICKIWEEVNNITLKNRKNDELYITLDQRKAMVDFLDTHEKLMLKDLYSILGISKQDGWWGGKAIGRGLQGNTTKIALKKALGDYENAEKLLQFNLKNTDSNLVDEVTGEIIQIVDTKVEKEPLYDLWHTVYSISDKEELANALKKKYNIYDEDIINRLYAIDFVKQGFGNKSAKAMRRILPYLQQGLKYSDACEYAGFRHSESLTKAEADARQLLEKLPPIQKNSLRQPIVEKILNQMINVVNALMVEYGQFDSIRVELARELKQSKDDRNTTFLQNEAMERLNDAIAKRLETDFNIKPTKRIIDKYKLVFPNKGCIDKKTGKFVTKNFDALATVNQCIYCGKPFSLSAALNGEGYEIEHIIPRDLLCDNSQSNKVLSCRKCNSTKNNRTAFDFMRSQDKAVFDAYIERVEKWYEDGIVSPSKRERLLLSHEDYLERKKKGKTSEEDKKYWEEFVSRQAGETQYISRESIRILKQCCRNVNATSGTVTATLRHLWGYDEILHQLNFERYKQAGLTETVTWTSNHGKNEHSKEQIVDWSKRIDHRHHAIDALVVACTQQGFIQRINTLNADDTKDLMRKQIESTGIKFEEKKVLLDKYLASFAPFTTKVVADEVNKILVSFKAGKKSASTGKRIKYVKGKKEVLQEGIIIPRGALHEEGVYGQIEINGEKEIVKKYKLGKGAQGFVFTGKETYEEKVKKTGEVKVDDKIKNVLDSIVDGNIRAKVLQRLNQGFEEGKDYRNDVKKALDNLNNLEKNPIFADENETIPIRTVRCRTGLSAVVPVKRNEQGKPIGFVKPGNNHHISIYRDKEGQLQEHTVTFWHAVERKKYGLPVIIENPTEVWDSIMDKQLPESFLEKLPDVNWAFEMSLQQNEMFVLGMEDDAFEDAMRKNDYLTLGQSIYKVQNLSEKQYRFSLHTATKFDVKRMNKADKSFYNIQSIDALLNLHPHKVHISVIGKIKKL